MKGNSDWVCWLQGKHCEGCERGWQHPRSWEGWAPSGGARATAAATFTSLQSQSTEGTDTWMSTEGSTRSASPSLLLQVSWPRQDALA